VINLENIYNEILTESSSRAARPSGGNLEVHLEVDFDPNASYYIFKGIKSGWFVRPSLFRSYIKDDKLLPTAVTVIQDKYIKGANILSYVKKSDTELLSGINKYHFYCNSIGATKDIIFCQLISERSKTVVSSYLFINADKIGNGAINPEFYYGVTRTLNMELASEVTDPTGLSLKGAFEYSAFYKSAIATLPFIEDYIKAYDAYKQGTQSTGGDWDISGLTEEITADGYYPYGRIEVLLGAQPEFNETISIFVAYLKEVTQEIPEEFENDLTALQIWYDNIVENFIDSGDDQAWNRYGTLSKEDDVNIVQSSIESAEWVALKTFKHFLESDSYKDYLKAQNVYRQGTQSTSGEWDIKGLTEQSIVQAPDSFKFGKYTIFKDNAWAVPYDRAKKSISKPSLANLDRLESIGFKFITYYGTSYSGFAVYGLDPNKEEIMYVRKTNTMSAASIYYTNKRGGQIADVYRLFATDKTFTVEEFLKGTVSRSRNHNRKMVVTIRPDGKVDVIGDVRLGRKNVVDLKNFELNSTSEIPVKFGNILGDMVVMIPVNSTDWFPETIKGRVSFYKDSRITPEQILQLGWHKRLMVDEKREEQHKGWMKDHYQQDTGFVTFYGYELDGEEYGARKFTQQDWDDLEKAQEIYKQGTQSTGGDWDISGLA